MGVLSKDVDLLATLGLRKVQFPGLENKMTKKIKPLPKYPWLMTWSRVEPEFCWDEKNFIFNWDRLNWKLAYFRYRRWVNCGECSVTLVTSCLIHMVSGVLASFKKSLERCGDFWHIATMTFGEVFSGFQKSAPRPNLVNTPGCSFCWHQNGSRCGPRMPITQFIQDHRRNIGWRQWKFFRFSSLLDEYDFCCFSIRDLPSEWVMRGPVPEA